MSEGARAALAPSGTLRAAINLGNPLLVSRRTPGGEIDGVAPAMARAIARQLESELQLVPYPSAGAVAEAAGTGEWDVGLIADDPARRDTIRFSPPYVQIPATYIVQERSGLTAIDRVDREGITIVAVARSAYALWLTEHLSHATLLEARDDDAARDLFVAGEGLVLAGLAATLHAAALATPGTRVLPGQFMAVQQAIGTSIDNASGAAFVSQFIADMCAAKRPQALIAEFGLESALAPSDSA